MPKTEAEIKAVIFDIGNVLVHWDVRALYSQLITDQDDLEYFLHEIITMEWHTEHDRGRPFSEGVKILSAQYPEYAELIAAYDTRWNDTIGEAIGGTVDLLGQLKQAKTPVYGLTNFNQDKWAEFKDAYDFVGLLDGVVVSGEEQLVKPDPAIFDLTLSRFDLTPDRTLFIDDNYSNVRAAEKMGIKTHHFKGPEGLALDLKEYGLID